MRNEQIIERPADQNTLTKRYTEEAVRFIERNKDRPFFLYLAQTMVHVPLFVSDEFRGKSPRGLYGDAVEEIDWSVGRILETLASRGTRGEHLRRLHLGQRPLADLRSARRLRGPAARGQRLHLRGRHARALHPVVAGHDQARRGPRPRDHDGPVHDDRASWPAASRRPTASSTASTCGRSCSAQVPARATRSSTIAAQRLYAVRKGPYKAHFVTQSGYGNDKPVQHDPPLLYHLGNDPSEQYDLAKNRPEVIAEIRKVVEQHRSELIPGEDQLAGRIEKP